MKYIRYCLEVAASKDYLYFLFIFVFVCHSLKTYLLVEYNRHNLLFCHNHKIKTGIPFDTDPQPTNSTTFFLILSIYLFWQGGETICWRVCYQWGLPRLVYRLVIVAFFIWAWKMDLKNRLDLIFCHVYNI